MHNSFYADINANFSYFDSLIKNKWVDNAFTRSIIVDQLFFDNARSTYLFVLISFESLGDGSIVDFGF